MSDSLLTKLSEMGIKAIDFTQQSAQNIYKFLEKEAPLLLQEWLTWNFWVSLSGFVFGLILIISFLYLLRYVLLPLGKYQTKFEAWFGYDEYKSTAKPVIFGSCLFVFLFFGLIAIARNLDWLQIWLAPRVYILENIKDLIK